jgi:hypothetical protein
MAFYNSDVQTFLPATQTFNEKKKITLFIPSQCTEAESLNIFFGVHRRILMLEKKIA